MAILGLVLVFFAIRFSDNGNRTFVFLTVTGVAIYVFFISARIYFSDFKAPDVIPQNDRQLLVDIIKSNGKDGLDVYIKLSSLYGFTGNATKLGLTGLPLLTVALTVFFTSLAAVMWSVARSDPNSAIIGSIMDLAKLTLGAFIGSFVQRSVSAISAAERVVGQAKDDSTNARTQ